MATNHGRLLGLYDEVSSFLTQINLLEAKGSATLTIHPHSLCFTMGILGPVVK